MNDLVVILGLAAAGYALAYWLRLPSIPLLLAVGFLASLTPLAPTMQGATNLVQLGLAFLVFAAGIELTPSRFKHQTGVVIWVALAQFFIVGAAGYGLARFFGFETMAVMYTGFALSASSTLVVIRHLRIHQQMFQPFGRVVTGVLLLQDVILVALLVVLDAIPDGPEVVARETGIFAALAALAAVAHYRLLPWLTVRQQSDEEILLLIGIATLFFFVGIAWVVEIPFIAGALLAGFALSAFPVNGLLRGLVSSLSDFFRALFFTALGTLLSLGSLTTLWQAFVFAAVVVLLTPPIVMIVAEWRGQTARSALESGLLLAQSSEIGIVLAMAGWMRGMLNVEQFSLVGLVAAFTMALTPFLATDAVTWKLLRWHPSRRRPPASLDLENHVLVLGLGSAGMWVVKPLLRAGYRVLVVDDDPNVIDGLSNTRVAWWRGDGSDEHTLSAVRARSARLILASLPKAADIIKVIRYAKGVPVVARVFEDADAELIEREGGTAILNSEAASRQFLSWFENFHKGVAPEK